MSGRMERIPASDLAVGPGDPVVGPARVGFGKIGADPLRAAGPGGIAPGGIARSSLSGVGIGSGSHHEVPAPAMDFFE